jgi:hypothetical protein
MKKLVAVAVCLAAVWSSVHIGQEEEKRYRKAGPDDYKKLAKLGSYTGKLAGVGAKSVTFRIDDTDYQARLKWAQGLPAAQQKQALSQVETQYAQVKWALGKEFEIEFADKIALRKLHLPFEYDDKGNPKKYTAADLAKLKGTGGHPGYVAKPEDFTPGALATATFSRATKEGRPTVAVLIVDNK